MSIMNRKAWNRNVGIKYVSEMLKQVQRTNKDQKGEGMKKRLNGKKGLGSKLLLKNFTFLLSVVIVCFSSMNAIGAELKQEMNTTEQDKIIHVKHVLLSNYYIFEGRRYYSLYPLLNTIEKYDTHVSRSLINACKVNHNISLVSGALAIGSGATFFMYFLDYIANAMSQPYPTFNRVGGVAGGIAVVSSGVSLISLITYQSMEIGLIEEYNNYIKKEDKNIGLKFSYHF